MINVPVLSALFLILLPRPLLKEPPLAVLSDSGFTTIPSGRQWAAKEAKPPRPRLLCGTNRGRRTDHMSEEIELFSSRMPDG